MKLKEEVKGEQGLAALALGKFEEVYEIEGIYNIYYVPDSVLSNFVQFWGILGDFGNFWGILGDFGGFSSIFVDFGNFLVTFGGFSSIFVDFGRFGPSRERDRSQE